MLQIFAKTISQYGTNLEMRINKLNDNVWVLLK